MDLDGSLSPKFRYVLDMKLFRLCFRFMMDVVCIVSSSHRYDVVVAVVQNAADDELRSCKARRERGGCVSQVKRCNPTVGKKRAGVTRYVCE